jgi:hypothetical protein
LGEIIEHNDAGNGGAVRVGEAQSPVSIKVYQAIYHQITGRTEQVRKRYSDNLLVDFSELKQLHHKVMQLCDIHKVIAHNETISVFHEKERKEQFTSFDRFENYNSSTTSPTVNVVLKHNFSSIPAGLERAQEYVVTIRLTSRVAAIKQLENDAPPYMRGRFFGFMVGNTAEITIDYADYVIARGFLEAFDEWISGCKASPKNKCLHLLRMYSHHLPDAAQLVIAGSLVFFGLQAIPLFFAENSTPITWARFLIIYSGSSYILIKLAHLFSALIEDAIDSFPELSYLQLNKGDVKLIEEADTSKSRAFIRGAIGASATILLGIVSAKLEKLI